MKRHSTALSLLLAVAVGALAIATAGSAHSDRGFAIGAQLQAAPVGADQLPPACSPVPTPPAGGTSSGTFTAAGAIADYGTATACFRISPDGGLAGGMRFVGLKGTFELAYEGFTAFSGPPGTLESALALGDGRILVTAGSGAYATLKARGRFDVVANLVRGDITATVVGRTSRSYADD
ncbi:MAG TPA: hypothetical protein VH950_19105 [Gaiellaceae bacterium]